MRKGRHAVEACSGGRGRYLLSVTLSLVGLPGNVLGAAAKAAADTCAPALPVAGPPGFAMAEPTGCGSATGATTPSGVASGAAVGLRPQVGGLRAASGAASSTAPINGSFSHSPTPDPSQDLPAGSGPIMPTMTIYIDFWLPTGQQYESTRPATPTTRTC